MMLLTTLLNETSCATQKVVQALACRNLITANRPVFRNVFLFALLLVLIPGKLLASKDPEALYVFPAITLNAEATLQDPVYFDPVKQTWIENVANDKYDNTVSLVVNEETTTFLKSDFTCKVTVEITYIDVQGNTIGPINKDLIVTYKKGSGTKYDARQYYYFKNARQVKVKIIGIDTYGATWNILPYVKLENRMIAYRDYNFNCQLPVSYEDRIATDDALKIQWIHSSEYGATHYDVEWSWIDNNALDKYKTIISGDLVPDARLIFRRNATRVTIDKTNLEYTIPMLYDGEGRLYYRIRPVQYRENGDVVNGAWSVTEKVSTDYYYEFTGHENNQLNWQASTSYAEEGKLKSVIQYFDGTLRARQTVTKDNSTPDKNTVVAETYYDYQGRPAINILPAPTLSTVMSYARNFNKFVSAEPYPKDIYDLVAPGSTICNSTTPALDDDYGTAKYYSANNPLQDGSRKSFDKFIPDANGYPYTETRYLSDGSGRIAEQSGVGPDHQLRIGSDAHQTKYFYSTPDQKELDALFGIEAGYASHYAKNIVQDANGQLSVSYVDMHGRTVATALAGLRPAQMDPLPSYNTGQTTFAKDLITEENNVVQDRAVVSTTTFVVTSAGDHEFKYKVSPYSVEIKACNPNNVDFCYECYYELEIKITDQCGTIIKDFIGKPFHFGTNAEGEDIFSPDCRNPIPADYEHNFTLNLPIGEYNVTKTLRVSKAAQDWYRTGLYTERNICKTLLQFKNEIFAVLWANSDCATMTCTTCTTAVGTYSVYREKFLAAQGISSGTTVNYENEILASYTEALAACEILCKTTESDLDIIREQMLQDMTPPFGQYATEQDPEIPVNPMFSILYKAFPNLRYRPYGIGPYISVTPSDYTNAAVPYYKTPLSPINFPPYLQPYYNTITGSRDLTAYEPNSTLVLSDVSQFVNRFSDGWAYSMLRYHPEFNKLLVAQTYLQTSYRFDADLALVETWEDAVDKHYINDGTSMSNINSSITMNDPFFKPGGYGNNLKSTMDAYINSNYRRIERYTGNFPFSYSYLNASIWKYAYSSVVCQYRDDSYCIENSPSYPTTFVNDMFLARCEEDRNQIWQTFKTIYLTAKNDLIYQRLLTNPYDQVLYPNLKAFKHIRRFGTQADMVSQIDDMPDGNDPNILNNQYKENCEAYKEYWRQQLDNCPQYKSLSEVTKQNIESELAKICVGGSDETHAMGSSSVAPNSSLPIKRFEDLLQTVFNANGISITSLCHPFMIDYPRPYEEQPPVSNEMLGDRQDNCLCTKLNDIKQKMSIFRDNNNNTPYPVTPSTLPQYMKLYLQNEWGYTVKEELLETLINGCNPKQTCVAYDPPIEVPGFLLDCKPLTDNCINCSEYRKLKAEFLQKYPAAFDNVMYANPATEEEERLNVVFEQFMNIKTGLNLRWQKYLEFEGQCPAAPAINCGELQNMVNLFFAQYTNSVGLYTPPANCEAVFVAAFNSYFLTSHTTFSQIMAVFKTNGCPPPRSVCRTFLNTARLQKLSIYFYETYGSDYYEHAGWDTTFVNFFNHNMGTDLDSTGVFSLIESVAGEGFIPAGNFSYAHLTKVDSTFIAEEVASLDDDLFSNYTNFFNERLGSSLSWDSIITLYNKNAVDLKLVDLPINKELLIQLNEQFKTSGRRMCATFADVPITTNDCYVNFIANSVGISYTLQDLVNMHNIYFLPVDHLDNYFEADSLITFYAGFIHDYKDSLGLDSCISFFTQQFNNYYGSDYDFERIQQLYKNKTGITIPLCSAIPVVNTKQVYDVYNDFIALYPFPQGYFDGGDREKFRQYFNSRFSTDFPTLDSIRNFYYFFTDSMPARYEHLVSIGLEDNADTLIGFKSAYEQNFGSYNMPRALTEHLFTTLFNRAFQPGQYHNFKDIMAIYGNAAINIAEIYSSDSTGGFGCQKLRGIKMAYRTLYYSLDISADSSALGIFDRQGINEVEVADNIKEQSRFTTFLNLYMRTGFGSYQEVLDSASTVCGFSDYAPTIVQKAKSTPLSTDPESYYCKSCEPLLCGRREPRNVPVPPKETCEEELEDIAWVKATEQYNAYVQVQYNNFDKAYLERCLEARHSETFTVKAVSPNAGEYHFTLYYYDQAGNLVKTVPPEGVHPIFDEDYFADMKEYRKNGGTVPASPVHTLLTEYRYNSLNQVVAQRTPDAGISKFWYDRLGRLVVSQNAKQREADKYSYTLYDPLGRVKEVGEKPQSTPMEQGISQLDNSLADWLSVGVNKQSITRTTYDFQAANVNPSPLSFTQANLRNRVSYMQVFDTDPDDDISYEHNSATYYSYDIHGNVDKLLQDYGNSDYHPNAMNTTGNRFKLMEYKYDLISGKVNMVAYQPGMTDGYYHQYAYDAENRLTEVYTSRDKLYWEREASYQYYLHGPLARTIIGQQQVQGIDYAYTLQGWLKGVNSSAISGQGVPGTCQPGTGKTVLDVSDRMKFGQPDQYIASQSVSLLPGFTSTDPDNFVAEINPSLTPCVPSEETNIPYINGDMGEDGDPLGINPLTGRDAFGFALHYYQNETAGRRDYKPIAAGYLPFANGAISSAPNVELFNGNIAGMSVNISILNTPMLTHYRYDQLNRIVKTYTYKGLTTSNGWDREAIDQYRENISYDANGNILRYERNGNQEGTNLVMDNLTYQYPKDANGNKLNNRLRYVHDQVPANRYAMDIDNQTSLTLSQVNNEKQPELSTDNYRYDEIGNLIEDKNENINSISWNVYGKIERIQKTTGVDISYTYDGSGNRISKNVTGEGGGQTWYVRDAGGNVMAVYQVGTVINSNQIKQTEVHLYGSSRLGILNTNVDVDNAGGAVPEEGLSTFTRGNKLFELSNHLGNVLATVSDKKIQIEGLESMCDDHTGECWTFVDYYAADVISANDYYPFGMNMPGRNFNVGSEYRYGFNGQEKTPEIIPNSTTAEFWQYDARLGRRWNVDPIYKHSPYGTFGGNPIFFRDPNGLDTVSNWRDAKKGDVWGHTTGKSIFYYTYNGEKWESSGSVSTVMEEAVIVTSTMRRKLPTQSQDVQFEGWGEARDIGAEMSERRAKQLEKELQSIKPHERYGSNALKIERLYEKEAGYIILSKSLKKIGSAIEVWDVSVGLHAFATNGETVDIFESIPMLGGVFSAANQQMEEVERVIVNASLANGYADFRNLLDHRVGKASGLTGVYVSHDVLMTILQQGYMSLSSPDVRTIPVDIKTWKKLDYFIVFPETNEDKVTQFIPLNTDY